MISQTEINEFMNSYEMIATGITTEKIKVLEDFRITEIKLKDYNEALNDLEKQQNKINLNEFGGLRKKTLEILKIFDPINIDDNIHKISETVEFFRNIENELIEVSDSLISVRRSWNLFLDKNTEFKYSIFSDYVNEKEDKLKETLNIINPREIGILSIDIEKVRQEIELIIINITKIKELLLLNIFMGDESKKIEEEISLLMNNYNKNSVSDFSNKAKELIERVESVNTIGKVGTVPVEVVRFENGINSSLFKYTLKFGDHILKYDTFFNADKVKIKETGKFVFIDNFPLDGIFKGRDIIENIDYNDNYINAVEDFSNTSLTVFISMLVLILITTGLSLFVGGFLVYVNLILAIAAIIGFNPYLSFLQVQTAAKYGLKKIFIYSKIDFFIASKGQDTDMNAILLGIIQDFDLTILNDKFHNEGNNY